MALIKCKECGKDMSDTAKRCPSCGFQEKKKSSKKPILMGISFLILVVLICGSIFIFTREKPLTNLERQAVDCIIDFKSMLKNSESLQVHEIKWSENELVDGMIFIYVDVSGQNGFGGNNRHIIRYGIEKDGNIEFQGSSDGDDNSWEELMARKIKEGWSELSDDNDKRISVERVMKEVNKK